MLRKIRIWSSIQVCYVLYPNLRYDTNRWWIICKIKYKSNVDIQDSSSSTIQVETESFQGDEIVENQVEKIEDNN